MSGWPYSEMEDGEWIEEAESRDEDHEHEAAERDHLDAHAPKEAGE